MKKIIVVCLVFSALCLGILAWIAVSNVMRQRARIQMTQEKELIWKDIEYHNQLSDFIQNGQQMLDEIRENSHSTMLENYAANWPFSVRVLAFQNNPDVLRTNLFEMQNECQAALNSWNETNSTEMERYRLLLKNLGGSE